MGTVNVRKDRIGAQDVRFGRGTFARQTSTGGSQTLDKIGLHSLNTKTHNIADYGAVADSATDCTAALQAAIDAAAPSINGNFLNEDLGFVYVPGAERGYLIDGQITLREGVCVIGESYEASRLFLSPSGWTANAPKFVDSNFDGSTKSENFGMERISLVVDPRDPAAAAALSGVAMIHLRRATEFQLRNVRFAIHTYYAALPPYGVGAASYECDGVTGVRLQECVAADIDSCHFDRGYAAIECDKYTSGNDTTGIAWSRISNNYWYNQSAYALRIGASCYLNTISGNVIDHPRAGSVGIALEDDADDNTQSNTITGNVVRCASQAVVCAGNRNSIAGNVLESTLALAPVTVNGILNAITGNEVRNHGTATSAISLAGSARTNYVVGNACHQENSNAVREIDSAVDNIILDHDRRQGNGVWELRGKDVQTPASATWYDLVQIYVPDDNINVLVHCDANVVLNGIGMVALRQVFHIYRGSGALTAAEIAAQKIEHGSGSYVAGNVAMRWTAIDNFNMKLQIQRNAGTSSAMSAVIEATGMGQRSREKILRFTDLNI